MSDLEPNMYQPAVDGSTPGVITKLANTVSQTLCRHTGAQLYRVIQNKLYLECMSCGDTTTGVVMGR
jgi:hypothetical protein